MRKRQAISGGWLGIMLVLCNWQLNAQGRALADTIITTKGAVTLITSSAPISTFQIGDGKNADYDYRIVDGNLVFIRPIVTSPKTTNLIVREGENIHYLILTFRDKADLTRLKYTLSGQGGAIRTEEPATVANAQPGGNKPAANSKKTLPMPVVTEDEKSKADMQIDTVTVGSIAEDFRKQKKSVHQYEARQGGITLSFTNAMVLNDLIYFSFRIRNRAQEPYEIAKVTMMYKNEKDPDHLYSMPVLYKRGPMTIGKKDEQHVVFVAPSREFKRNDEVIVVMQNNANQDQLVLYTPVKAFPKYMIGK